MNDLRRIFHKLIGQLGNVDQAILLYAHIYKGSELGDIGDDSGQFGAVSVI